MELESALSFLLFFFLKSKTTRQVEQRRKKKIEVWVRKSEEKEGGREWELELCYLANE